MTQSSLGDSRVPTVVVSVIVPVFNVPRALLDRCLTSVFRQTHRSLDVVVIDDGSYSTIGAWLDCLPERDLRARVFHQSNQGVSVARNRGLTFATGEYVCFVDGDDYVKSNFIESALRIAQ